jgi:hypothetical protein
VLRVSRAGGSCGLGEKLGHGARLNRAAGHLGVRARGSARRASAPDSGASPSRTRAGLGDDPDGRAPPVSDRRRERGGRGPARGQPGSGEGAGAHAGDGGNRRREGRWAARPRSEERKGERVGPAGLGCKGKREKKKKKRKWVGPN